MENSTQLLLNHIASYTNNKSQSTFDILKPTLQLNRSRADILKIVWFYMEKNWTLKDETSEYFLLTTTKATITGHFLIAIFFGWWLIFIPNFLYHYIMKKKIKLYK